MYTISGWLSDHYKREAFLRNQLTLLGLCLVSCCAPERVGTLSLSFGSWWPPLFVWQWNEVFHLPQKEINKIQINWKKCSGESRVGDKLILVFKCRLTTPMDLLHLPMTRQRQTYGNWWPPGSTSWMSRCRSVTLKREDWPLFLIVAPTEKPSTGRFPT